MEPVGGDGPATHPWRVGPTAAKGGFHEDSGREPRRARRSRRSSSRVPSLDPSSCSSCPSWWTQPFAPCQHRLHCHHPCRLRQWRRRWPHTPTLGTLAYVETECPDTTQGFVERQALRIRLGDREPVTVFETPDVGPIAGIGGLCSPGTASCPPATAWAAICVSSPISARPNTPSWDVQSGGWGSGVLLDLFGKIRAAGPCSSVPIATRSART